MFGITLLARTFHELLEWIPYDRLINIKFLATGGFNTIYKATWLDGFINEWDYNEQKWFRVNEETLISDGEDFDIITGYDVVLKSLNNSSNLNDGFLNEV